MEADIDGSGEPSPGSLVAISVRDLSVSYRVYADKALKLRELVTSGFRSRESRWVEALRGVSLDISVGETVGVVGFNGSGKSTLLGAMAGVRPATMGEVLVRYPPVLLSVGSALMPELSGYRNIEMGGLAMGLSGRALKDLQDEVADFTELGEALSRPLRTYSSGMRARLAFAIATTQRPEILLIDEALAVGDKQFKAKSLQRVEEIREAAGTIVMVTHNLEEVRKSCTRAVWLHQGLVAADGEVDVVLNEYSASV